jgi:hypothetical protein
MKHRVLSVSLAVGFSLLILLLTSCAPEQQPQPVAYPSVCGDGVCSANEISACGMDCNVNLIAEPEPTIKTPSEVLDDLRSRIRNYTPEERLEQTSPQVEADNLLVTESFESYLPEKGFRVASRFNLLAIGENISRVMGTLNSLSLRETLRGGSLRHTSEAFGSRAALYSQFLKLRSGKVVFGYDENADVVSTYLSYKEEEPIWDYLLELNGGIFKFFEGEEIHFLGHDYVIGEVTNTTMKLIGVTTPDTLYFRDQRGVWINDKEISSETLNVSLKHDSLRIVLKAPDDINILPGTSLRSYLRKPAIMLTNRIDIVYEGLNEVPAFDIKFDKSSDKYKLSFVTNNNLSYALPFSNVGNFELRPGESNLVFQEGINKTDYVIKKKDYFVIDNKKGYNGLTNIIRFIDVQEDEHLLVLEDPALEKFLVYFTGVPGINASADLIINRVIHKVYIGKDETLAVDLDGNGRIASDNAPIITAGSGIIRINQAYSDKINLSFITPKEMRENAKSDLETIIIIRYDGISIDKNKLEMLSDPEDEMLLGMTDYGTLFVLKNEIDDDTQSGEDLIIKYPIVQRFADVIVKVYE